MRIFFNLCCRAVYVELAFFEAQVVNRLVVEGVHNDVHGLLAMAHTLACGVRDLRHVDPRRTAVVRDTDGLHHHRERILLHTENRSAEERTDAEGNLDASVEVTCNHNGLVSVEAIRPASNLRRRVDSETLVVRDKQFTPLNRVARIVASTVEQLGVILIEVTQEREETVVVGESNAEVAVEFLRPVFEDALLSKAERNVLDALIGGV